MWDTIAGFFGGGGGGTLQEVTPNYRGMYEAAPNLYEATRSQSGLGPILPDYAGHAAAAPGLTQAAYPSAMEQMFQGAAGALSNLPQKEALQPGKIQAMQGAPSGLLDFYSRELGAFNPPQSASGLLTMPRWQIGVQ